MTTAPHVALFATCITDTMKPSIPIATVKLLERLGCRVSYPEKQTCCGQIMTNTGYWKEALPTVRNYAASFGAYDYIVNGKPALDWVVERQCVKTDKDSGIVNDANDWAVETMNNPRYPLELFMRVITVSMETMKIVRSLPKLNIFEGPH